MNYFIYIKLLSICSTHVKDYNYPCKSFHVQKSKVQNYIILFPFLHIIIGCYPYLNRELINFFRYHSNRIISFPYPNFGSIWCLIWNFNWFYKNRDNFWSKVKLQKKIRVLLSAESPHSYHIYLHQDHTGINIQIS